MVDKIVSKLIFTQQPTVPWFRLLLTPRNKLKNGSSIPRIEAEWKDVTITDASSYNEICGFQNDSIPITYPQVLATPLHMQILADKRFPLPALGLVHLYQEIEVCCPLEMGLIFDIVCWVEGHEQVAKGVQFEIKTVLRSNDTIYWKGTTTIFSRSAEGNGIHKDRDQEPIIQREHSKSWSIPENLGRRYTSISGDFNPIHLYSWTAKPFGFSRHIIHGMWALAHSLSTFDKPIKMVKAYFIRPIYLPSIVEFHVEDTNGEGAFVASNPDTGKTHLWGTVTT